MMVAGTNLEMPLVISLLKRLPLPSLQHLFSGEERNLAYGRKQIAITRAKAMSNPDHDQTIFSRMLRSYEKSDTTISSDDIAHEANNFTVGGTDTTSMTLTYLTWAVLKTPQVRDKLHAELSSLPEKWTSKELEPLPYLNAVIEETLRLYNGVPGSLPRVVPGGGRMLGGYFIPEGMIVSTQSYSIHRDPAIFVDPLECVIAFDAHILPTDHVHQIPA